MTSPPQRRRGPAGGRGGRQDVQLTLAAYHDRDYKSRSERAQLPSIARRPRYLLSAPGSRAGAAAAAHRVSRLGSKSREKSTALTAATRAQPHGPVFGKSCDNAQRPRCVP